MQESAREAGEEEVKVEREEENLADVSVQKAIGSIRKSIIQNVFSFKFLSPESKRLQTLVKL